MGAPKPVGFGRLAYDPVNGTFWYYGFGKCVDQGGVYPGPTNFGCDNLDTFMSVLKKQLEFAAPDIKKLCEEKTNADQD